MSLKVTCVNGHTEYLDFSQAVQADKGGGYECPTCGGAVGDTSRYREKDHMDYHPSDHDDKWDEHDPTSNY